MKLLINKQIIFCVIGALSVIAVFAAKWIYYDKTYVKPNVHLSRLILPEDIAVSPNGSKLAITNSAGQLAIISLDNAATSVTQISEVVGALVFTHDSANVFIVTQQAEEYALAEVNSSTNKVAKIVSLSDVTLSQKNHTIAISPDDSTVYLLVHIKDGIQLWVIDILNKVVKEKISVGENKRFIALVANEQKLYVVGQTILAVDLDTNKVVETGISFDDLPDSIALSLDDKKIAVSLSNNSIGHHLFIVDSNANKVTDDIIIEDSFSPTGKYISPNALGFTQDGLKVFAIDGASAPPLVLLIDVISHQIIKTTVQNSNIFEAALSPDASKIYISIPRDEDPLNSVNIIDTNTNTVSSKILIPDR